MVEDFFLAWSEANSAPVKQLHALWCVCQWCTFRRLEHSLAETDNVVQCAKEIASYEVEVTHFHLKWDARVNKESFRINPTTVAALTAHFWKEIIAWPWVLFGNSSSDSMQQEMINFVSLAYFSLLHTLYLLPISCYLFEVSKKSHDVEHRSKSSLSSFLFATLVNSSWWLSATVALHWSPNMKELTSFPLIRKVFFPSQLSIPSFIEEIKHMHQVIHWWKLLKSRSSMGLMEMKLGAHLVF